MTKVASIDGGRKEPPTQTAILVTASDSPSVHIIPNVVEFAYENDGTVLWFRISTGQQVRWNLSAVQQWDMLS